MQVQAELLFALARHLQQHPDAGLLTVDVRYESYDPGIEGECHISPPPLLPGSALAAWAGTLRGEGDNPPVVEAMATAAHSLDATVEVTGLVEGGHRIRVWVDVPGLADALGLPDPHDPHRRVPVTVEQLYGFDAGRRPVVVSGVLDDLDGLDGLAGVDGLPGVDL